jgi:hypothetical protein
MRNCGKIPFEVVAEEDVSRIGTNPMVNKLVKKSKYDLVCFLHDDSVPQGGFLDEAVRVMNTFPAGWGIVGFNDGIQDEDGPCTHWLAHKKMLKFFPDVVFYSEDYIHTRVDVELKEVAKAINRYKWAENARVDHLSPIHVKGIRRDRTLNRCYDKRAIKRDEETYQRRKRERVGKKGSNEADALQYHNYFIFRPGQALLVALS